MVFLPICQQALEGGALLRRKRPPPRRAAHPNIATEPLDACQQQPAQHYDDIVHAHSPSLLTPRLLLAARAFLHTTHVSSPAATSS